MDRGQTARLASATACILFACLFAACMGTPASDKGEESPFPIDGAADSAVRVIDHGSLTFGTKAVAELSPRTPAHAWTFELPGGADVTLRTVAPIEGGREVDTVLALYRRRGDGWGQAIAANDDISGSLWSGVSSRLEAGTYRVMVKGYRTSVTGGFAVLAECSGACAAAAPSAASRLARLPDTSWPAPLTNEPRTITADVLMQNVLERWRVDPVRTPYWHMMNALAAHFELPDPTPFCDAHDTSRCRYGTDPAGTSWQTSISWGAEGRAAELGFAASHGPLLVEHLAFGTTTLRPMESLRASETTRDPRSYWRTSQHLLNNPWVPADDLARLIDYADQTMGAGPRYDADVRLFTVDDIAPRPLAATLDRIGSSPVWMLRAARPQWANQHELLTPALVDEAAFDSHHRVRLAAAPWFFQGSDRSEAAQRRFLATLGDPEIHRELRLEWIRSRGFSELFEEAFADYPGDTAIALRERQAAFVGALLTGAPADQRIDPILEASLGFAEVSQVWLDAFDALRASTVYTDAEKIEWLGRFLDAPRSYEWPARLELCALATELVARDSATADMVRRVFECFDARFNWINYVSHPNEAWPHIEANLLGDPEARRSALREVALTRHFIGRVGAAAGVMRAPETADVRETVLDQELSVIWRENTSGTEPAHILRAYIAGGGSPERVAEGLRRFAGATDNASRPTARWARLYEQVPTILRESGMEGQLLVDTVVALLFLRGNESLHGLWESPGTVYQSYNGVLVELLQFLAHPSVTDAQMVDGLYRIAVPDGVRVPQGIFRLFTEANVDQRLMARMSQAYLDALPEFHGHPRSPHPRVMPGNYVRHILPAASDWTPPNLTDVRVEAVRARATEFSATLPEGSSFESVFGAPRTVYFRPAVREADALVEELLTGTDDGRALQLEERLTRDLDLLTVPEERIDAVIRHLRARFSSREPYYRLQMEIGAMMLRCAFGATYDELRAEFATSLGFRWDLADRARADGEGAALRTLLTSVGQAYDTSDMIKRTAQVCTVHSALDEDVRTSLVATALADMNENSTFNDYVLWALLQDPNVDFARYRDALDRRAYFSSSYNGTLDLAFLMYLIDPRVPFEQALRHTLLSTSKTYLTTTSDPRWTLAAAFQHREGVTDAELRLVLAATRLFTRWQPR